MLLLLGELLRVGVSRLWQALLADRNCLLARMFEGKIGPFPEKLGFGSLYPWLRTQATYFWIACRFGALKRPRAGKLARRL